MSKISKKKSISLKGIVSITEDNQIIFEVEDMPEVVELANLLEDFDGQEISLSVNQTEEIC